MGTMDQTDQLINELVFVLQQCEEMYGKLLPIIEQEKQVAMASNLDQLSQLNDDKTNLIAQLKKLDHQRESLIGRIAGWVEIPKAELTLTKLIDRLPENQGKRLAQLNASLKTLFVKVQFANSESRMVVSHCLTLVKNSLNYFNLWTDSGASYGASGNMKDNGRGYGRFLSNSA
jgi:flagellar biosynthesis/type III secretory pathway chaperone